jgi:hypothetical protein
LQRNQKTPKSRKAPRGFPFLGNTGTHPETINPELAMPSGV